MNSSSRLYVLKRALAIVLCALISFALISLGGLGTQKAYAEGDQPDVEEYRFPEDREMLPGWDGWIDTEYNAWIANKDYPKGKDFPLAVSDVRIENANPSDVLLLEGDASDGWRYEATKLGSADIVLIYEDYDGTEKEYCFTVNVSDTVYEVNLWPVSGEWQKLPGESLELEADAVKKTAEQDENNPDDWHHEETRENLGITWSLGEGSEEWATLTPHTDDSTKATLTFKDMPEGWNHIGERVDVCVRVADTSDDPDEVRAERWEDFYVNDAYFMIAPALVDSSLDVGESMEITPELRYYEYGKEGYETRNAHFRWYYNPDAIVITDANEKIVGNNEEGTENYIDSEASYGEQVEFHIKRLRNSDERFEVKVDIQDEGEWKEVEWREYWLDELNYEIWFDDADPGMVFTDGDKELIANVGGYENYAAVETAGYSLEFEAGFNYNFESGGWGTQFEKGKEYSVDGKDVTIHGAKLDPDKAEQQVYIIAKLKKGEQVLAVTDAQVYFKQAHENYNLEQDRSMLPGWDGWINSEGNVWVENTKHPEGDNLPFEITDVEIESQTTEDPPVIVLEERDANGNWRYEAKNYGEATVKLIYEDHKGVSQEHRFKIYVGSDVYHVNVNTADGKTRALPGDTVTLIADVEHHSEDPDRHGNIEDVIYDWNEDDFNNGEWGDYATLTVDSTNSSRATLTFKDLSDMPQEVQDGKWKNLQVEVTIYDGEDDDNKPIERGKGNINIDLANEFLEVAPYTNNRRLAVGDTETITAELRSFPGETGNEYDLRNAHFRWYYNPEAVEIRDSEDNLVGNNDSNGDYIDSEASYGDQVEFRIKRLGNSNESFEVKVDIQDKEGNWNEVEWREYWLDELDYDIWFEPDQDHTSCNIVTSSFSLKKGNDVKAPLSISYEVGEWDGDVGEWSKKLESGTDYTVKGDVVSVTNKMALEKGIPNVGIRAMLKSGNEVIGESWAWLTIEDHNWDEGEETTHPTCTGTGIRTYTCSICNDTKTEEIPAMGHTVEIIPAVAATCTEGGKTAGKKCSVCQTILEEQKGTEPAGHKWNSGVLNDPQDENEERVKTFTCSVCNETRTEEGQPSKLEEAKDNAEAEIKAINSNNYSGNEKEAVEKAKQEALDAIENANSIAEVNAATQKAKDTVAKQKTDAVKQAEAKQAADAEAAAKKAEEDKAKAAAQKATDELKEWNGTLDTKIPAVKKAKFKAAKKKVTVSWTKANKMNLKKFTNVEVQVCKDKKFQKSNTKRVVVKKSKKAATVKGLKKGTYYVRVRNVKGSGAVKLVSKWSKVKKLKLK